MAPAATVRTALRKNRRPEPTTSRGGGLPSPATSEVWNATIAATHLRANILQRVLQLDLLRHGQHHPCDDGRAEFFSITAFGPLDPNVIFYASARILTRAEIDCREFRP